MREQNEKYVCDISSVKWRHCGHLILDQTHLGTPHIDLGILVEKHVILSACQHSLAWIRICHKKTSVWCFARLNTITRFLGI